MAKQTLNLILDEDTTIMVQISNSDMNTDEFIDFAVDLIHDYNYDDSHYYSTKTETTQY